jgi:glycolate oxidase FAD binding subunit
MKNVAGYDVSRALVGAMGIFGALLSVSMRVSPIAAATATLRFEMAPDACLAQLNAWGGQPLPVTGSAWVDGELYVRLSGARAAVSAAIGSMGGELVSPDRAHATWQSLRDHQHAYFNLARGAVAGGAGVRLWRLSVPQTSPVLPLAGEQLIEWGGAQRWLCTPVAPTKIREAAERVGGHATLFAGRDASVPRLHPLTPPIERIHRDLKRAFDPDGVFNPARLYPTL